MRTYADACSRMRTYGGGKEPADANVDVKEAVLISEVPPALRACGRSCRGRECVCLRRRHHYHAIRHLRTSAYVSIRQHTSAYAGSMMTHCGNLFHVDRSAPSLLLLPCSAPRGEYVSIHQHT
jgi:hypothetical protein